MDAEAEVEDGADVSDTEAGPQSVPPAPQDGKWWEGGQKKQATAEFTARRLDTPLDKLTRRSSGRRSVTKTDRKRGRYIQSRLPKKDKVRDLAFDATLRASAAYQRERKENEDNGMALQLRKSDLREKVRVKRASNLIMFCVDASWSMAVSERMEATKGAIMSLLTDAYQRRDRVGLIVFHKNDARLVLQPTNSVLLAKKALKDIQVGGKTPLSAGLMLAHDVIKREGYIHPDVEPLMILLTDGAGNVSIGDRPPQEEAHQIANTFADHKIRSLVINMEHPAFDQGLAAELAEQMDAPCTSLADLRAETLYKTVVDNLK